MNAFLVRVMLGVDDDELHGVAIDLAEHTSTAFGSAEGLIAHLRSKLEADVPVAAGPESEDADSAAPS